MRAIGGWHRLWIVVSATTLIPTIAAIVLLMPDPTSIPHQAAFYENLSAQAKAQLMPDDTDAEIEGEVQMPNGHRIKLRKGVNLSKATSALSEYQQQVDSLLLWKQIRFGLAVIAIWLTFCLSLLLGGHAIAWVRRGFSATQSKP